MEPWKIMSLSVIGGGFLFFAPFLGMIYFLYPVMAAASDDRAADGRYVVSPYSPLDALWILDTRTGRVRTCTTDETALSPICGDWSED